MWIIKDYARLCEAVWIPYLGSCRHHSGFYSPVGTLYSPNSTEALRRSIFEKCSFGETHAGMLFRKLVQVTIVGKPYYQLLHIPIIVA